MANDKVGYRVKNEIIFGLGILLLELSYGQPLEAFKTPADVDERGDDRPDGITECLIVERLAKELHQHKPWRYAGAVVRCIEFRFNTLVTDLTNPELEEQFHRGGVVPVQELYEFT